MNRTKRGDNEAHGPDKDSFFESSSMSRMEGTKNRTTRRHSLKLLFSGVSVLVSRQNRGVPSHSRRARKFYPGRSSLGGCRLKGLQSEQKDQESLLSPGAATGGPLPSCIWPALAIGSSHLRWVVAIKIYALVVHSNLLYPLSYLH